MFILNVILLHSITKYFIHLTCFFQSPILFIKAGKIKYITMPVSAIKTGKFSFHSGIFTVYLSGNSKMIKSPVLVRLQWEKCTVIGVMIFVPESWEMDISIRKLYQWFNKTKAVRHYYKMNCILQPGIFST